MPLVRDLCAFRTGVVADDNERLFARLQAELPLRLLRWRSGDTHNGWTVPDNWRVEKAEIRRGGKLIFDGTAHTLGVATLSNSFQGTLSWEELRPHLVTSPALPDAYVYHFRWQYRPWATDWALSVPHNVCRAWGPGIYEVDLRTVRAPGEMIVAEHEKRGRTPATIVFQSHNCHPQMANDGFAGTAMLVRLFQWLAARDTHYSYRLVIAPELLGTIFYLRDMPQSERAEIRSGVFAEMPGTSAPIKIASTFLGNQTIDRAFRNAARHPGTAHELASWRQGAGNDETVWEAPGYEVPFVEVTRSESVAHPFREFHSSLDTPDLMQPARIEEMLDLLKRVVEILESDCRMQRRFDGILCLSNPAYDLFQERLDPTLEQPPAEEARRWDALQDFLMRYLDGSMTILDIAERHDLPFRRLSAYLRAFAEKGLIDLEFAPIKPVAASRAATLRR